MSNKLSPSQAFIHIVALWPNVNRIEKTRNDRVYLHYDMEGEQRRIQRYMPSIEWGTLTEYPVKEKWRDATKDDVINPNKKARFSDNGDSWREEYLIGTALVSGDIRWIDNDWDTWKYCQVLDASNDLTGATTMSEFNRNDFSSNYIFYMGGIWRAGSMRTTGVVYTDNQSGSWDRAHQPTHFKRRPKDYTEEPINEDDWRIPLGYTV